MNNMGQIIKFLSRTPKQVQLECPYCHSYRMYRLEASGLEELLCLDCAALLDSRECQKTSLLDRAKQAIRNRLQTTNPRKAVLEEG